MSCQPPCWLDYYDSHVILCYGYYTSHCIQQTWKQAARFSSSQTPKYAPDCNWSPLPSLLKWQLPIALNGTLLVCLTYAQNTALKTLPSMLSRYFEVHFQACYQRHFKLPPMVHSWPVWLYDPKKPCKMLPSIFLSTLLNTLSIALHNPSQSVCLYLSIQALKMVLSMLQSTRLSILTIALEDTLLSPWLAPKYSLKTLQSTILRGKSLSISLHNMPQWRLLHAQCRDLLCCRSWVPRGIRMVAYATQCIVGGQWKGYRMWHMAGGWWCMSAKMMTLVNIILWYLYFAWPP